MPKSFSFKGPNEEYLKKVNKQLGRKALTKAIDEAKEEKQEVEEIKSETEQYVDEKIRDLITDIQTSKIKSQQNYNMQVAYPDNLQYILSDIKPQLTSGGISEPAINLAMKSISADELKNCKTYKQHVELITSKLKPVLITTYRKNKVLEQIKAEIELMDEYDSYQKNEIIEQADELLDKMLTRGDIEYKDIPKKIIQKILGKINQIPKKDITTEFKSGEVPIIRQQMDPKKVVEYLQMKYFEDYYGKLNHFNDLAGKLSRGEIGIKELTDYLQEFEDITDEDKRVVYKHNNIEYLL